MNMMVMSKDEKKNKGHYNNTDVYIYARVTRL